MTDTPPLSWPDGTAVLHIIAQSWNHQPAAIVGTREGLEALRDAITRALDTGASQSAQSMACDGEGYSAVVVPVTPAQMDEVPLGYTDPDFGKPDWPRWLLQEVYRHD